VKFIEENADIINFIRKHTGKQLRSLVKKQIIQLFKIEKPG